MAAPSEERTPRFQMIVATNYSVLIFFFFFFARLRQHEAQRPRGANCWAVSLQRRPGNKIVQIVGDVVLFFIYLFARSHRLNAPCSLVINAIKSDSMSHVSHRESNALIMF